MILIGISGYARSGKDLVADIIAEEFGYTKIALVQALQNFLYELNPYLPSTYDNAISLQSVINRVGWNGYKLTLYHRPIRELLQRLGDECANGPLQDMWVHATLDGLRDGNYVMPGVRRLHEAAAVEKLGGEMWRINRPGVGPINRHRGETYLDGYDFKKVLQNDGNIGDLRKAIVKEMQYTNV